MMAPKSLYTSGLSPTLRSLKFGFEKTRRPGYEIRALGTYSSSIGSGVSLSPVHNDMGAGT
jgi:hypothetical protein